MQMFFFLKPFKATSRYNKKKKHKGFQVTFRAKVQFTCWLRKMSDDPLYLSGPGSAQLTPFALENAFFWSQSQLSPMMPAGSSGF